MRPDVEQSLVIEFDELFALKDRLRAVADQLRERLYNAGMPIRLETDVFDHELEMRGEGDSNLVIRMDSYHLEISGAPPGLQVHAVAAIMLDEAGAYRLSSVECGFSFTLKVRRGHRLDLIARAFSPVGPEDGETMLDRRFSMSWDWGNATTGYSFHVSDTEDRELFVSFKAREGYMTYPELAAGAWIAQQEQRFDQTAGRFLSQLGWQD